MTPLVFSRLIRSKIGAAHQAEIAVDVAQPQAEQQADDVVIDAADDDAMQRIRRG